jgi:hypothetical protein
MTVPKRRELGTLTKSGKILGVRSFYNTLIVELVVDPFLLFVLAYLPIIFLRTR